MASGASVFVPRERRHNRLKRSCCAVTRPGISAYTPLRSRRAYSLQATVNILVPHETLFDDLDVGV